MFSDALSQFCRLNYFSEIRISWLPSPAKSDIPVTCLSGQNGFHKRGLFEYLVQGFKGFCIYFPKVLCFRRCIELLPKRKNVNEAVVSGFRHGKVGQEPVMTRRMGGNAKRNCIQQRKKETRNKPSRFAKKSSSDKFHVFCCRSV